MLFTEKCCRKVYVVDHKKKCRQDQIILEPTKGRGGGEEGAIQEEGGQNCKHRLLFHEFVVTDEYGSNQADGDCY